MFLYVAIAVLLYLVYKWGISSYDYFEKKGIAFSKPMWLIGSTTTNMFINRKSFPETMEIMYNEFKHEKVSGMFEFKNPVFIIRDPEVIKKVTIKDFDHFQDHRFWMDEKSDKMLGKSLMALKGQTWRDMRATLSPMFTGSKMRLMYEYVAKVGQQTASTLKDTMATGGDNIFEFKALAGKFTVDIIASSVFGIEVNSLKNPENDFQKMSSSMTQFTSFKMIMRFMGFLMFPSLMKALKISMFGKAVEKFFEETVNDIMRQREEQGIVRNDMIDLVIQAKKGKLSHETKENEKITEGFATVEESQLGKAQVRRKWDDDDLLAQCFLFFFAGFEPIATAMSFMVYELTVNPDIQNKLYNEIKDMNDSLEGKTINYDQIQGMKYLDQVVCETMRKWPASSGSDRICVKDYQLDYDGKKFTIEKDMIIFIPVYGLHRDPDYFPDPTKFDPERFSAENRGNIISDTYLPFGIGPRNCIGSRFALMELKTIFFYLMLNFKFEVTEKTQIPLKYANTPIGVRPEKGIWLAFKPREK